MVESRLCISNLSACRCSASTKSFTQVHSIPMYAVQNKKRRVCVCVYARVFLSSLSVCALHYCPKSTQRTTWGMSNSESWERESTGDNSSVFVNSAGLNDRTCPNSPRRSAFKPFFSDPAMQYNDLFTVVLSDLCWRGQKCQRGILGQCKGM